MPRAFGVLLVLAVASCNHEGPFDQQEYATERPFISGPPRILTANRGVDAQPAVLPDHSAYIYSFSSWYEPGDICLGLFPVGQARVSREFCPASDTLSHDQFFLPAVAAAGRVVFLLTRSHPFGVGPYFSGVVVAPLADIRVTSEIIPVPLRTPDGVLHDSIDRLTRLGWIRGDTLAVLLSNRI